MPLLVTNVNLLGCYTNNFSLKQIYNITEVLGMCCYVLVSVLHVTSLHPYRNLKTVKRLRFIYSIMQLVCCVPDTLSGLNFLVVFTKYSTVPLEYVGNTYGRKLLIG